MITSPSILQQSPHVARRASHTVTQRLYREHAVPVMIMILLMANGTLGCMRPAVAMASHFSIDGCGVEQGSWRCKYYDISRTVWYASLRRVCGCGNASMGAKALSVLGGWRWRDGGVGGGRRWCTEEVRSVSVSLVLSLLLLCLVLQHMLRRLLVVLLLLCRLDRRRCGRGE